MLYAAAFLALLPITLSTPSVSLDNRQTTCATPSEVSIDHFSIFTPASNSTGNFSIGFSYYDNATNVTTTCVREFSCCGGQSLNDPNDYFSCEDPAVNFLYSNGNISLTERIVCYDPYGTYITLATANATIGVGYCIPNPPGTPLGPGTLCELPGGGWRSVPVVSDVTSQ